ncbi:MAG: GTP cyclohydrolase [Phaeodactylibacter sp.]|nr:GTP cyclohydrolase [Phaeodactylibacter sp.]MCB9300561.1 GTP cyclohydrolase [Lewinellaceae bacterium]
MKGKMWFALLALVFLITGQSWGQKPPETEKEFDEGYQNRIGLEYIDGVYIPKDLSDALVQLNKLVDRDSKASFKSVPEEEAVHKLFFSLGRWITRNWGFYEGSRLSNSIRQLGVYHPEDMAVLIIRSFHRSLNQQPIDVKGQVAAIQAEQKKRLEERIHNGTILYEEKKQLKKDTLDR